MGAVILIKLGREITSLEPRGNGKGVTQGVESRHDALARTEKP